MWKYAGIRLGIACKNSDCANCITGRCIYPERNFSLNISEKGTCENFVPKEKYSADISSLINRLRAEAKANHELRADFIEYISKSIRRNSEIEKLKADRLAEEIVKDFVEGGLNHVLGKE